MRHLPTQVTPPSIDVSLIVGFTKRKKATMGLTHRSLLYQYDGTILKGFPGFRSVWKV